MIFFQGGGLKKIRRTSRAKFKIFTPPTESLCPPLGAPCTMIRVFSLPSAWKRLLQTRQYSEVQQRQLPNNLCTCSATPMCNLKCRTVGTMKRREKVGIFYGNPTKPSLPDPLKISTSFTSTLPICHKQHLELISLWTNVVGSIFQITRRNQDLDTKLKVQNKIEITA